MTLIRTCRMYTERKYLFACHQKPRANKIINIWDHIQRVTLPAPRPPFICTLVMPPQHWSRPVVGTRRKVNSYCFTFLTADLMHADEESVELETSRRLSFQAGLNWRPGIIMSREIGSKTNFIFYVQLNYWLYSSSTKMLIGNFYWRLVNSPYKMKIVIFRL